MGLFNGNDTTPNATSTMPGKIVLAGDLGGTSSAPTVPNKQAADATLTALAAYNTNGILTQTAADTFAGRTLTGTASQITVTNGDGVSGGPTLSVPSPFAIKAGNSTGIIAKVSGTIFDSFTDTTVGGAEADIYTNTIPASVLNTNGDKLTAVYSGNFVTVGTELTQLKVYFDATGVSNLWDSTALAPATGTTSWRVNVEIIRVSATVVRYTVSLNTSGATGYVYCTSGELTGLTLSGTNILRIRGTSSGVGSGAGDIIGKMAFVRWESAA